MLIRKAYRYRLYPKPDQEQIFAHNFGQARFVYNRYLAERKAYYRAHKNDDGKKGLNYNDNAKALKERYYSAISVAMKDGIKGLPTKAR